MMKMQEIVVSLKLKQQIVREIVFSWERGGNFSFWVVVDTHQLKQHVQIPSVLQLLVRVLEGVCSGQNYPKTSLVMIIFHDMDLFRVRIRREETRNLEFI
jgi:hypothetical protein